MIDDVATVAAGLSEGQRALVAGPAGSVSTTAEDVYALLCAGLYDMHITPRGAAIRDHILKEQKGC